MDIGEIRGILVNQYIQANHDIENGKRSCKFRRAVKQIKEDIETLDEIMSRNFGMGFNDELKIYE